MATLTFRCNGPSGWNCENQFRNHYKGILVYQGTYTMINGWGCHPFTPRTYHPLDLEITTDIYPQKSFWHYFKKQ